MAFEITNQLRSSSIIRVEGASTVNVNVSQLSTNTALETDLLISNVSLGQPAVVYLLADTLQVMY